MKWLMWNKKSQVAPFLVLLIAVLLLAIVATMLIGEASFNKIRMANVTDGALLTATSAYCRSLNQIRQVKASLETNHWFLQAFVGTNKTNCCGVEYPGWAWVGEPITNPTVINTMLADGQLYETADKTGENAVKELRSGIYDGIFGAGLADEPKPFLESEVYRDAQGRPSGFDFQAYLKRDSRLTVVMRKFKADDFSGWYGNSALTYYFSKSKDKILPLLNNSGEPIDPAGYTLKAESLPAIFPGNDPAALDAYLNVNLNGLPTKVDVEPIIWSLFYLVWKPAGEPCVCKPWPGWLPNPDASLSLNIEGGGEHLEVDVTRSAPYKVIFFQRQLKTEHKSKVFIRGSLNEGYENKMEQ